MRNIMVMTLVAFVLAPFTFADGELESGGELQRVGDPEPEQVAQETSSQADGDTGTGSESEAVDEPVEAIGDPPASE